MKNQDLFESDIWALGVLAFYIMCGEYPFNLKEGESENDLIKKIIQGRYSFTSPIWEYVSNEARDFIKTCMNLESYMRPPASYLLQHPWLK